MNWNEWILEMAKTKEEMKLYARNYYHKNKERILVRRKELYNLNNVKKIKTSLHLELYRYFIYHSI